MDEKFVFYQRLRSEDLVQRLDVEKNIRKLTQDILMYASHVNIAKRLICNRNEKLFASRINSLRSKLNDEKPPKEDHRWSHLSELEKEVECFKLKQIDLNFADVAQIAYHVWIYLGMKSYLFRILSRNPMMWVVNNYKRHYDNLKKTGKISKNVLEYPTYDPLMFIESSDTEKQRQGLEQLIELSKDYLNRQISLIELSKSIDLIKKFYVERRNNELGRIQRGDWSWIFLGGEERLSLGTIKKVSLYLKMQARVNEIRFKILYFGCMRLQGKENAEVVVEESHSKLIQQYLTYGFNAANYAVAKLKV